MQNASSHHSDEEEVQKNNKNSGGKDIQDHEVSEVTKESRK